MLKTIVRQICPPIIWTGLATAKYSISNRQHNDLPTKSEVIDRQVGPPDHQDLDIYWDPNFAEILESWGEGNAWSEIEFLMINCKGKVLDIACGTGKVTQLLSKYPDLAVYGCDISDFLIQKAIDRGIPPDRLRVCDATKMDYQDDSFDYAYSVGSLEHFTEDGIVGVISECYRTTNISFHLVPVSRSNKDEGWTKTLQSFYNNSVDWWLNKFRAEYKTVHVLDSKWQDSISVGKWFVCVKD